MIKLNLSFKKWKNIPYISTLIISPLQITPWYIHNIILSKRNKQNASSFKILCTYLPTYALHCQCKSTEYFFVQQKKSAELKTSWGFPKEEYYYWTWWYFLAVPLWLTVAFSPVALHCSKIFFSGSIVDSQLYYIYSIIIYLLILWLFLSGLVLRSSEPWPNVLPCFLCHVVVS